jgi:hypothetical protein
VETPLLDESGILAVAGVNAAAAAVVCGVLATAGARRGRDGLATCREREREHEGRGHRAANAARNAPTIGPKEGSGGRGAVVLVRGVMVGEVGHT